MKNTASDLEQKIKASTNLMFDLDDTLVHTGYANFLSYSEAFRRIVHSEFAVLYNPLKRFTRETLIEEFPFLSREEIKDIVKLKDELYSSNLNKTELNHPVAEILSKYKKANKTILVTNSRKKRAVETLKHHELFKDFSSRYFKPKHQGDKNFNKYENALKALNIHPFQVVVFENDRLEIHAAVRAGVPEENIIRI